MKIPKRFLKWFQFYGWMDDGWNMERWETKAITRIAWRAYRKGVKDEQAKAMKRRVSLMI